MFARSTTVSSSFGYNLYNMPIVKNFIKKDYDLLNIVHTLNRPYFFGIGIPCKFSCNDGFAKDEINLQNIENKLQSDEKIFEEIG
jgi:hypothetical protein